MGEEQRTIPTATNDAWAPPRAAFGAAPMVAVSPRIDTGDRDLPRAARSSRLFARIIDYLLILAVAAPAIPLIAWRDNTLSAWIFLAGAILLLCTFQWWLIATRGQTLGKRMLQIRVRHTDGTPVTFWSGVVLREWAPLVVGLVPFLGRFVWFVDAVAIFRKDERCLHDLIAGTEVVELTLRERGIRDDA